MQLTERYIELCKRLAAAGYRWLPRAGDWMVDLTDDSIGMLTIEPDKPEQVAMVNVHLPLAHQLTALLGGFGIEEKAGPATTVWLDAQGHELHTADEAACKADLGAEQLTALVMLHERSGAQPAR